MFKNLFGGKDEVNQERETAKQASHFNSYLPDEHVNPKAPVSQKAFEEVKEKANSMKLDYIRIRGLLIENQMENSPAIAKVEVLCFKEDGVV